jgi:hypothetical protein
VAGAERLGPQLYRDLYQEFSAKHFHEHLVAEYNFPFCVNDDR